MKGVPWHKKGVALNIFQSVPTTSWRLAGRGAHWREGGDTPPNNF